MKFCEFCGKEVDDDARFCPNCGHPFDASSNWATIMGIISLVLSTVSCFLSFLSSIGPRWALFGISHRAGILAMSIVSRRFAKNKTISTLAIIATSISLALCLLFAIVGSHN